MKKKPILLSTLTLMAGMAGVTNIISPLSMPVLATDVVDESTAIEDLYIEDLFEMNTYFAIKDLRFPNNMINYKVALNSELTGAKVKRVLIVQRNYEAGVSESEADAAVKTLGVGDNSWYTVLSDKTTQIAATSLVKVNNVRLENNLSDVIYYAIQYGDPTTDENGNTILKGEHWVRGKLDYRQCTHSVVFDAATMFCSVKLDRTAKTARLVFMANGEYQELPEGEQVISWDEEWRAILEQRIVALNTQLVHMNQQLPTLQSTLLQAADTIKKLEVNVPTVNESQDLEQSVAQLQELLQNLQLAYDRMTGTEQQKLVDELRASLNTALMEVEQLKQQLSENGGYNQNQQELEKIRADLQSLQAELTEVNKQAHDKTVELDTKKGEILQLQAKIAEILLEKEKIMQDLQVFTDDKTVLATDNERLQQENAQLRQDVSGLQRENATLRVENASLQAKNSDLLTQNEQLQARIRELEAKTATQTTSSDGLKEKDVIVIRESVAPEVVDSNTTQTVAEKTEEIEVPDLGIVETKTNFWWVIAAIVGALGVLVACCKRYLGREH